jgi:hypothetical protein
MSAWLRRANQYAEFLLLAGPADDQVEELRKQGYRPETAEASSQSRLEWERLYVGLLKDDPVSRTELRVRVMARELIHEHLNLFNELTAEYRVPINRAFGIDPAKPGSGRAGIVAFADRIPSMRIAVDMKVEMFRNAQRGWQVNDLHDIDALSLAVPYCHLILSDRDAVDRLRRTGADARHGTEVLSSLADLPAALGRLVALANDCNGDPTGWDVVGPGQGFTTEPPERWQEPPTVGAP